MAGLFRYLGETLKRGGNALLQAIVVRDELFAGYRKRSDFIRHYVFPGGLLPSVARLREEADRVGLKLRESFAFGQDYARTLREWGARMRARETEIRALGYDDKMLRNWHFYLGFVLLRSPSAHGRRASRVRAKPETAFMGGAGLRMCSTPP
ncbi:MAG: class I SAM-dependent methyltransferase [Rhizomicrobium sp.]